LIFIKIKSLTFIKKKSRSSKNGAAEPVIKKSRDTKFHFRYALLTSVNCTLVQAG